MKNKYVFSVLTCLFGLSFDLQAVELSVHEKLSEDILREIVGFESTAQRPEEILYSLQAVSNRLQAAGFPEQDMQLVNPEEGAYGLVVRYRGGAEQRPMLLLAHIDVVPAVPDEWSYPPYSLGEKDGYYLGRGTSDNKGGVTQIVSNFIRLKHEGWLPNRDLIAVITGNEETSGGVALWLATQGRDLVDAEFALNTDAGGGDLDEAGKPRAFWIQTSEKLYHSFHLTTSSEGGHSSVPKPDNAIAELAVAISRVSQHEFPLTFNSSTLMNLKRSALLYPRTIAKDMRALVEDRTDQAAAKRLAKENPWFNAIMRTTCTPTMLESGHAENALPRTATVTVNCRIFPGVTAKEVEQVITGLLKGLDVEISTLTDSLPSDPSELPDAFLEGIEELVEEFWGDIPSIPEMSTGATDGLYFRNAGIPAYGVGALFSKPGEFRAHGLNERIDIKAFHEAVAFWYEMLKNLSS